MTAPAREPNRRLTRRQIVDVALLICGLVGLTLLTLAARDQRLRHVALGLLLWQLFWSLVRLALLVGVWRRETALGGGRKLWLGLTLPLPLLFAVWSGRGALSAWMTAPEEADREC